jgi:tetraacyldisaccharide 4'-kinase
MSERLLRKVGRFLSPLGWLYGRLMAVRAAAYGFGIIPSWRAAAPVISVGNIGWGGAGKTPLAGWLLDHLLERNRRPCLLSRGYGGSPPSLPHPVGDDDVAAQVGDEPLLLARAHPEATILVDPSRARSGAWAEEFLKPGAYVLDDGFQHLTAVRDLDLVLLRPGDVGPGWGRVIPSGSWREPASALHRAHALLMKLPEHEFAAKRSAIELRLGGYGKPFFTFALEATGLHDLHSGERTADLGGEPYVLAAGIVDPDQAARTAATLLGKAPQSILRFPDHHPYTDGDIARMLAARGPDAHLVVTAKDAVKLAGRLPADEGGRVWSLGTDVVFGPALWTESTFPDWIDARLTRHFKHQS